jgi:hypothetical protein
MQYSCLKIISIHRQNYWGIININLDVMDQLLIGYWRKNGSIVGQYITYLWILKRPMTLWREKYCTIFSLKVVYLWIYETYSEVCIDKNLLVAFSIQNGLEQGDASSPLLFTFTFTICYQEDSRKSSRIGSEWNTLAPSLGWMKI